MTHPLDLSQRDGLPDALTKLLAQYPRDLWAAHSNFDGLVAFWLERHVMFRRLMATLISDAEVAADAGMDAQVYKGRVSKLGSTLLNQLHGHHQIEDQHYFPQLAALAPSLQKGFDLLDSDHHAMDGLLERFAQGANGVIAGDVVPGAFRSDLLSFEAMLDRHLLDEEHLIVPVILDRGPDQLR